MYQFSGTLLMEARGEYGQSSSKIVTMNGDNGKTIAEIYDAGIENDNRDNVWISWHEYRKWYVTVASN